MFDSVPDCMLYYQTFSKDPSLMTDDEYDAWWIGLSADLMIKAYNSGAISSSEFDANVNAINEIFTSLGIRNARVGATLAAYRFCQIAAQKLSAKGNSDFAKFEGSMQIFDNAFNFKNSETYKAHCKEQDRIWGASPSFEAKEPASTKTTSQDNSKSSGCYIATCAYGSYDCPEVWTLRRFRDNFLAKHVLGRAFIKTYYAISPKLIARFGHIDYLKSFARRHLDKLVSFCQKRGFENTRYYD